MYIVILFKNFINILIYSVIKKKLYRCRVIKLIDIVLVEFVC